MKKRVFIGVLLGILLAVGCFASVMAGTSAGKEVDVMFLHDTHSHIQAFPQIKTLIKQKQQENPETLLLDAGDFSMGTLVQVMYEEEASELRMLGELGMDVTTFGNHEFDYKAKGLANMLTRAKESEEVIPALVVCNVDWDGMEEKGLTADQKLLKKAFQTYGVQDYVVLEKKDVKIAVIGVFGEDCLECVPNCPLEFTSPVMAVKETVKTIQKKEEVDMIVCVSHSGTWEQEEKSEDEILAKIVPELDLIISGHTHTKLEQPIRHGDTYIVSAAEYGKYLGNLSMTQKKDGRWSLSDYALLPVDASVDSDAETQAKVDGFMDMVDQKYLEQFGYTRNQVLCTNEIAFASGSDVGEKHTEMNLGSIMADSYTYAVAKNDATDTRPVDVAVVPAGVIRDTYTKGNITTEDVFHSFSLGIGEDGIPGYPLISVYLTGKELKVAAEIDASISDLMTYARLYTDGLYWNYNPNRMILNKVTDVYLCDDNEQRVEIEDDRLYRVVTDFYTSQMLGSVTDLSYGLLSIVPKNAEGEPIERYEDAVIFTRDGKELKAWAAIAEYMTSFEDTDGDGLGNVPEKYGTPEGRKVVENGKQIGELLKHPNKFFFLILAVILVALAILAGFILLFVKLLRKLIRFLRVITG